MCFHSTHFSTCRLPYSYNVTCNFSLKNNSFLQWDDEHIQKCFLILHQMASDHSGALLMRYTFFVSGGWSHVCTRFLFLVKGTWAADRTLSGCDRSKCGCQLPSSQSFCQSRSSVMFTQLSILLSHNTELQGPRTSDVTRCQSITAVILCAGEVGRIRWVSQGTAELAGLQFMTSFCCPYFECNR